MATHTEGRAAVAWRERARAPLAALLALCLVLLASPVMAAIVSAVSPSSSPPSGNTTITLKGGGFTHATQVTFGGVAATFSIADDTTIIAIAPAHPAGPVNIVVTISDGSTPGIAAFTYRGSLSYIAPTQGYVGGGNNIFIYGSGLGDAQVVTVDGVSVPFSPNKVAGNNISLTMPPHAPGDVTIAVDLGGEVLKATYTYVSLSFQSISPSRGPVDGGTRVQITGAGFTNLTNLSVVAADLVTPVPSFQVIDDKTIWATMPAYSAGLVNFRAVVGGTSVVSQEFYTYYASYLATMAPLTGSPAGGTAVSFTGYGLTKITEVRFDGIAGTIFSATDTGLTVLSPPHAQGTVLVEATASDGSILTISSKFTYAASISSIAPAGGPAAGGTTIAISGSGLARASGVTFSNGATTIALTNVVVHNNTTITATTPAFWSGPVDVAVTLGPATVTRTGGFVYSDVTLSGVSPASGPAAGGTEVTLTGSGLKGATGVSFGDTPAAAFTVAADGNSITATTPAHAVGSVDILVTFTAAGTSYSRTLPAGYAYTEASTSSSESSSAESSSAEPPSSQPSSSEPSSSAEPPSTLPPLSSELPAPVAPPPVQGDMLDAIVQHSSGSFITNAVTSYFRLPTMSTGGLSALNSLGHLHLSPGGGELSGSMADVDTATGRQKQRDWNLFINGTFSLLESGVSHGTQQTGQLGLSYRFTPDTLAGMVVTHTNLSLAQEAQTANSTGIMLTPFVGGRLSESLFYDIYAGYGTQRLDLGSSTVSGRQAEVGGSLAGVLQYGSLTFSPSLRGSYSAVAMPAYLRRDGTPVRGSSSGHGEIAVAPQVSTAITLDNGVVVSPSLLLSLGLSLDDRTGLDRTITLASGGTAGLGVALPSGGNLQFQLTGNGLFGGQNRSIAATFTVTGTL